MNGEIAPEVWAAIAEAAEALAEAAPVLTAEQARHLRALMGLDQPTRTRGAA